MLLSICILSIFKIIHASCPENFDLVRDGQCRGPVATTDTLFRNSTAYELVVSMCKDIGAFPIIIHNEEENSYWANWKNSIGQAPLFNWPIGLACNTSSMKWEWSDGSPIDFKPKDFSPELEQECKSECSWAQWISGGWYIQCAGNPWSSSYVFCTKQLQQPLSNDCQYFQRDSEDDVCYQVGEVAESWQDAQMSCRNIGADLASIHNKQENSFVRRLAVSRGVINGVFLGASILGKGNTYGWIDGTAWEYDNFHEGWPKEGFGDCLAMDTSTPDGFWLNRDCTTKLPVACIRNETTSTSMCSSDIWKEGEMMTSPGFPYNASTPCEFFMMADEGKTVELEIILLEANTCCDNLLIFDDYLGGNLIANVTGEIRNVTFSSGNRFMKAVWQPNGGVNVRGAAMVFREV